MRKRKQWVRNVTRMEKRRERRGQPTLAKTYFANALKDGNGGLEVADVKNGQLKLDVAKVPFAQLHFFMAGGAGITILKGALW